MSVVERTTDVRSVRALLSPRNLSLTKSVQNLVEVRYVLWPLNLDPSLGELIRYFTNSGHQTDWWSWDRFGLHLDFGIDCCCLRRQHSLFGE